MMPGKTVYSQEKTVHVGYDDNAKPWTKSDTNYSPKNPHWVTMPNFRAEAGFLCLITGMLATFFFVGIIVLFAVFGRQSTADETMDAIDKLAKAAELLTNATDYLASILPENSTMVSRDLAPKSADELYQAGEQAKRTLQSIANLIQELDESRLISTSGGILYYVNHAILPSQVFQNFLDETFRALPQLYTLVQGDEAIRLLRNVNRVVELGLEHMEAAARQGVLAIITERVVELASNEDIYTGIHAIAKVIAKVEITVESDDARHLMQKIMEVDFKHLGEETILTLQKLREVIDSHGAERVAESGAHLMDEIAHSMWTVRHDLNTSDGKQFMKEMVELLGGMNVMTHVVEKWTAPQINK